MHSVSADVGSLNCDAGGRVNAAQDTTKTELSQIPRTAASYHEHLRFR